MAMEFTVKRYYLEPTELHYVDEDGSDVWRIIDMPRVETIIYRHAIDEEGRTDPRGVPISREHLRIAAAEDVEPNLWFAYAVLDPSFEPPPSPDVRSFLWHPLGVLTPTRRGVTFVTRETYDRALASVAAIRAA